MNGEAAGEAAVVNLFFTFRVFVVGAILFVFPRIARKGLLFGTYVGEAISGGDEARGLLRSWNRGTAVVMAVALVVGWSISLAGWPVPGNLTGTAVLLLAALVLYVWMYRKARKLAPPVTEERTRVSVAPLSVDESKGEGLAWLALVLCVLTAVATAIYAFLRYPEMPDQIPTYTNLFGVTEHRADRSIVAILYVPAVNLVVSSSFAMIALLTARAKRSVRGGSGGRSAQAQTAFRVATTHLFSGTALFLSLILAYVSVQAVRVALSGTASLGSAFGWICLAMILFMGVGLVRILKCFGQGGALIEDGSEEAPLTGGLANNARWIWGVFYVDRDDPSILVESRFGIGYTVNLGNFRALVLMGTPVVLMIGLFVLVLTGAVS